MDEVVIYTDGGCRGNPGPGAYAALLRCRGRVREVVGTEARTTNNRMELRAAIAGLSTLKRPCRVTMVTDSQYLRRGITEWLPKWIQQGWRTAAKKPVLNRDLWEEINRLCQVHQVKWDWVRGHGDDPDNVHCDRLVNEAMDAMEKT